MDRRQYLRRSGLLACGITGLAGCSAPTGPFRSGVERYVRQSVDHVSSIKKAENYIEGGLYGYHCHEDKDDEFRQRTPHRCGIFGVAFAEPAQLTLIDFDRLKPRGTQFRPEIFDFVVGTDFDDSVLVIIQQNPGDTPRMITTVNQAGDTLRIYLGVEYGRGLDGEEGKSQHIFVRLARDPLPDAWNLRLFFGEKGTTPPELEVERAGEPYRKSIDGEF